MLKIWKTFSRILLFSFLLKKIIFDTQFVIRALLFNELLRRTVLILDLKPNFLLISVFFEYSKISGRIVFACFLYHLNSIPLKTISILFSHFYWSKVFCYHLKLNIEQVTYIKFQSRLNNQNNLNIMNIFFRNIL